MKKLILTGRLAKEFGPEFNFDARDPAELIRALCYQVPAFEKALAQGQYRVVRLSDNGNRDISIDGIHLGFGNAAGIKIIPVAAGSKNKGLGKVIIGVALLGAVFMTAGAAGAFLPGAMGMNTALGATGLLSHVTYGFLASQAAMIAINGVAAMLTSKTDNPDTTNNESYLMDATGNVTQQGTAVPLVFGEVWTGSVVVSTGVSAEEYAS